MNESVESHNQKGGITAGSVNANKIELTTNMNSKKKRPWYLNPWLVVILGGAIAAIIAGLILTML